MVRDLCIDDPPDVSYTLGDLEWGCDLDAERHDSVESLRILIQHVLLVNEVPPHMAQTTSSPHAASHCVVLSAQCTH
jgi:hypothetical protein